METDRSHSRFNSLSQNWQIKQLPGLSSQDQMKLKACGIQTTYQLLQQTRTPEQKQALATQLQVREQQINKWVVLADLSRVPTVGCQYCGLLLHAGVYSVVQLAQMPAHKLHQQILRLQVATLRRPDLCPSVSEVTQWIYQARCLIQPIGNR